jgi:hypothetical protein
MGIVTVLQPIKAMFVAFIATLEGQVDWSKTMKNSGYHKAAAKENVSFTFMEEEEDPLMLGSVPDWLSEDEEEVCVDADELL